jgi:hypothetical protein
VISCASARRWLVEGEGSAGDGLATLRLACVDDDAQGETVEVLWDAELDGSVLGDEGWATVAKFGTDDPSVFSAYSRSVGILRPLPIVIYSRPHSEQASTMMPTPTPSRSSASTWFRRLWLRISAAAALGCRAGADMESAIAFDRAPEHEPGLSNGLSVRKTGNTAPASEPTARSGSGGNSVALGSVSDAGTKSGRVELGVAERGPRRGKMAREVAHSTRAGTPNP